MIFLGVTTAAVELALSEEASAATFIYRFSGDTEIFVKKLNRAMEAVSFKREIIRLTDEELNSQKYENYKMAAERTAAVRFLRSCFVGRVIHSNPDAWLRDVNKRMAAHTEATSTPSAVFCPACGAALAPGARFCGQCVKKPDEKEGVCSDCGFKNLFNTKFCSGCGKKLMF